MADTFNQVKDEHFMALLKRRLWMLAFPGEIIPVAEDITVDVIYDDNGCCGHDKLTVRVWKPGAPGITLNHGDLAELLAEFFGVEVKDA